MSPGADSPIDGHEAVVARLRAAGCVRAGAEADELRTVATTHDELERALIRREHGEPLEWIIGRAAFGGLSLRIAPGVYVPRDASVELARRGAELLRAAGPSAAAADLCTGAGAVAAYLRSKSSSAVVVGVDVDPRAVRCARTNGVHAVVGDVAATPLRAAAFDVVTAVAPYVPTDAFRLLPRDVQDHEPRVALDGGDDGLEILERVSAAARRVLRPGGWLLVEVGGQQDVELRSTLTHHGYDRVDTWADADGDLRGIAAHLG